jgi:predicted HTH transcriptional regulator
MKITELTKLLKAGGWNDVELKESRMAVPKSAFETVSAFANTHGWRLVFGDDSRLFEPGEKEVRSQEGKVECVKPGRDALWEKRGS